MNKVPIGYGEFQRIQWGCSG